MLSKAVLILEALGEVGVAGVTQLSKRTGLAKTTVHRTARELHRVGLVEPAGDAFRLAPKLFELGNRVPGRRSLRDTALPFLEHLAYATNQTIHLGVLEGTEVSYVERLVGGRPSDVPSAVAARLPLHCTATGKCLLAFGPADLTSTSRATTELLALTDHSITDRRVLNNELEMIRATGLASEMNEVADGFCSTAAPIRRSNGDLAGALSATGPVHGYATARIEILVLEAAQALSRRLGYAHSDS